MNRGYYIIGIFVLLYLMILVGKSVYTNWQTNQATKKLQIEIDTLEVENQNLRDLIAYYQTPSFKEKEARRKLGLVKPDEKVVIISKEQPVIKNPVTPSSEEPKKPNYQLWWQFFFENKNT